MDPSSQPFDRRTTKTRSVLFGALRTTGHGKVAATLGISDSTFSEWWQKNSDRICQLLTAIDHKPVPTTVECHSAEYLKTLRKYAAIGIQVDPDAVPTDERAAPLEFDE